LPPYHATIIVEVEHASLVCRGYFPLPSISGYFSIVACPGRLPAEPNRRRFVETTDSCWLRGIPLVAGISCLTHGGDVMYDLTADLNPGHHDTIVDAATESLQNSPYHAVRTILCEWDHGILFLRGKLSCFHHKQVAQETVARIKGLTQLVNEIQVDFESHK
jgi:hypothetical protein